MRGQDAVPDERAELRLEDLPGRVFLDTCVVNFILDHGEQIHEGADVSAGTTERVAMDIDALYNIFFVGQRAQWQLAVSPHTHHEVLRTVNPERQHHLQTWFGELWQYWLGIIEASDELPTFIEAEHIRVEMLASGALDVLPDLADRVLVCDALVYKCDLFCTRDWTTILRHRRQLAHVPIEIVSPVEWWTRIQPYAALFT